MTTPSLGRPLPRMANPLFLFLLLSVAAAPGAGADGQDPCAGRRIHIRHLPPRFNAHLLRHCGADAFPLADPSAAATSSPPCESLANHGLGPRTHPRSRSWYRTDPRLLEVFFHRRILERDCLADDPAHADAVFVPYYAALDALPYVLDPALLDASARHGAALAEFLARDQPRILSRRQGHDHFLVVAGSAWDYAQPPGVDPRLWGSTSLLRLPELANFTFLTLESRAWPWQEHAVPHPTSFHPASLPLMRAWLARARRARRSTLMLFAGGASRPSRPNIRGSILAQCANRTDACVVVDCSGGKCVHDPVRYMHPMLRARFCLQPPGDTPTRRSTFDAIIAGCVPVFFEDVAARRQYGWHLPPARYDEFSVHIPKEAVVFGGVKIAETLEAVPEPEVRRMRERLLELAPRVVYRRHGSTAEMRGAGKDAVDLAVDGVLRRIRRRVRALEDGQPERIYALEDDSVEA
ncbi:probable xyloglucan galactosyltransferase GT19 [Phragmites australis]|uniref:probable xyloglucan galactosyltransferase GT19 n=1 Tax=Phragmites australis TaxID=29695 RepID=UPI002D7A2A95|nr:probable xyloglucan galactosyltransferase GT19 [Phragmites australis]